jgi:hypothetical protein
MCGTSGQRHGRAGEGRARSYTSARDGSEHRWQQQEESLAMIRKIALSLLLLCALCAAVPSRADTITMTLTTASGLCSSGCTKVFSDVGSAQPNTLGAKILSTYQAPCNASINGTCTNAQVLTFYATYLRNALVQAVTAADENALINGYTPVNPQ